MMKDKKRKTLGNILFVLALLSPMVSFILSSRIGEVEIFGMAGMLKYTWVMWLFIPICVLSILIGIQLKKNNQGYKKNLIVGCICLVPLVLFGSYRFIFSSDVSYDVNRMTMIEEKTKINLPNQVKIGTIKMDTYYLSYAKITNAESKIAFEQEMKDSSLWQSELSSKIKTLLPINVQVESSSFDSFVFYNVTKKEYNNYPYDGTYECVFIAYDYQMQRLMILDNYTINLN